MRLSILNAIACMCQTICNVTSSSVIERLALCEQKGWEGECGWYTQRLSGLAIGCERLSRAISPTLT